MFRFIKSVLVYLLCHTTCVFASATVDLTPPTQSHLVSLSFHQVPVRVLLDVLARAARKNIILDDSIQGSVTLTLRDVTYRAALESVLHMQELTLVEDNGIWQVRRHNTTSKIQDLPISLRIVSVKHRDVNELAEKIEQSRQSLLSQQGYIIPDVRQRQLLIYEQKPHQQRLLKFIQALDQPLKQVRIEARIVTIDQGSDEALGIRWASRTSPAGSQVAGSLEALANNSDIADNLHVNLPIADASGRLAYRLARLNNRHILDLELSALEQENKAEVIASPSVLTLDRSTALIEQGTEIPYVEAASSGATSVVFKKAVLSLAVTPEIAADRHVILDLNLTQDTQGKTVSTPTGPAVSINAQTMQTKISIPSGQTLVLGGIYQKNVIKHESKVPVLGDIRWLGTLFKQTRYERRKRELMIFVTPTIMTN